ncbi:Heavy metal-associated isoprenylated plant protein 26 [Spatholobus suberectus]|nr:Heavy metal-associated isoprenylated plant protein 26 [Spatholobus suberectus]
MSKQDLLKIQSCILKVNIHCDGCEQKVKKLLQKIDGVYSVRVDADQGKVLVAGDVDPAKIVKKLNRAGKHAEIWGGQKGMMYNQNYPINPQFQNLQVDNGKGKGGKDNKSQNHKGQKGDGGGGSGGQGQLAHFQNIKGAQDLKVPAKEHKSVKFNLPEEEIDASDDGFDEYEDNFDDYDEEEEEGFGHGHGHAHPMHNKMMPLMGDGRGPHGPHGPHGMMNGPAINTHKDNAGGSRNNNGSVKKGDVIDQAMLIKGKGGNYNEAKNSNGGEKKSNQKGESKKGDKPKGGGVGGDNKKKNGKSDGGLLGRFLGFGKKSKKVEEATYTNKSKHQNNVGGNNKGKEGKNGEGKMEDHGNNSKNDFDFQDFDTLTQHNNGKSGKGRSNGKEGQQMGPSPIMGNYPMGQMENIPALQGLPAMNGDGGYYQGMQMQHAPYNNLQQQQYMGMMMNQQQHQQANMNNMYPTAMMYGRPHPSMNYMPPPPMPSHPMADPITHTFSDENVESCIIM